MQRWISYTHAGKNGIGRLCGQSIEVYEGNIFSTPRSKGESLVLNDVQVNPPCKPSKLIGLWNNYHAQASKQGLTIPEEPLYFIKAPNSYSGHDVGFCCPPSYSGRVVYEGELGVVIGKRSKGLTLEEAESAIFGYTCVNDITAVDLLGRDASFAQWTRAKGFDGFGAFGPVIATGLDWKTLSVRTLVNGRERQNYPCSDMIFSPPQLVSALSHDMTLMPGDVIACGTSLGVLPMKPGTVVEVIIDGIGSLRNTFVERNTE